MRRQNQDAYGVDVDSATGQTICVVCDGMGGPVGGDIASRIAVDAFLRSVRENLRPDMTPEQIREVSSYAAEWQTRQSARRRRPARNTAVWHHACGGGVL